MFERYTEKARRVIFFARYEASQFGQPNIETEHLLLGLLREDKALTNRFLQTHATVESIRDEVVKNTAIRERISTSIDLPLSNESKRVLAYAAEEAQRLGHKHIGTEHLLLGLMREEGCFAARMLKARGIELTKVRLELSQVAHAVAQPEHPSPSAEAVRDLTQIASDGELDPVVGREQELEAMMEILLSRRGANPMLVGERGSGKTALVEALAQRIADGTAPHWSAERRIVEIEPAMLLGGEASVPAEVRAAAMRILEARLESLVRTADGAGILFLDDLCDVLTAGKGAALGSFGLLLKSRLLHDQLQCIATATPERYRKALEAAPWLGQCFRTVAVGTMDAPQTLAVLEARKTIYEKFHEVTIEEAALVYAAQSASRYLPDKVLPGKALDLLDAAAARGRMGADKPPDEVSELRKRLRFIVKRHEASLRNHEFEKARFYSEEERKERENLKIAEERHGVQGGKRMTVGVAEVEAVIVRWGGYPYRAE